MPPKAPPTHAVLALIEQAVTRESIEQLGHYAMSVTSQLYWRGVKGAAMPLGEEAQDLVSEGLRLVLRGDRQWDPRAHPDFLKFMRDVIDSLASHRAARVVNREERLLTPNEGESDADFLDRKKDKHLSGCASGVVTREEEAENDAWFFALLDEVKHDPLLPRLLGCIMEGMSKRADLAKKLDVPVNDVTQAQKRLDRLLPKFREKYAHLNPSRPS